MKPPLQTTAWLVLALLLAAVMVGAATFDRRTWPSLVGDEATYLMAAESLAWDHDLRYERGDYDRFFARWGLRPEGLILQSGDGGKTLVYGKPAAYSLYLAPFVRLSPSHGPWVANALLLALAAVAAARALARRVGEAAPLWVAAFVFASVTFAYVFWAHADLFLACLAAIALALIYDIPPGAASGARRGEGSQPRAAVFGEHGWDTHRQAGAPLVAPGVSRAWRFATAGALLAIVVLSRPLYLPLLLPAVLAAPRGFRRRGAAVLMAAMVSVALASSLANLAARGSWSSYGGDRRSYYGYTGFPGVDAAAGNWQQQLAERGTHTWLKMETLQMGFDARQTAWNAVYYLAGRHVGVLPYFLPLLLAALAFRRGEGRWALPLAALFAAALLFWVRPFNFYGGGGAIANRYFLPAYPALWFLAARPLRGARAVVPPLVAAALAAPFLWPLWTSPRAFPIAEDGGYRWASSAARRWLPYETTLSHLKPAGQEDLHLNGLWVKLLTPGLHAVDGGAALGVPSGHGQAELLVGSPQPLAGVRVQPAPGERLAVAGAQRASASADGWLLAFAHPRAVHRMWWTDDPFYLYEVKVEPPASGPEVTFSLQPEARTMTAGPPRASRAPAGEPAASDG
ncbi:MAG TPA: hypothetical protein VN811_14130 [Thermoanaerobaculia bacterium]|nr:hypothetical protein [Thermoanaerobaculia bacterium]